VWQALAKRPADRFPSAAAFAAALLPVPPDDVETSAAAPASASHGRLVAARAAVYAAVVALVIGLVGGIVMDRSSLVRRWTGAAPGAARPAADAIRDVPPAAAGDVTLSVVDRAGRPVLGIPADRPWTPRFSPDGRRVAYGAFGAGRETRDLWITDLDARTTRRLTDDDADSDDPQWSPDGASIAYSANAPGGKDVMVRPVAGGEGRVVAARDGVQFPSDWSRDGSALLVTEDAGPNHRDVLVQPADGSPARPYVATPADEKSARISPDGRWVAYTSDASGKPEVYLDAYPKPGLRVTISTGGGLDPVWRGDGRELYYWRDGELVAVQLGAAVGDAPPARIREIVLFRAPYLAAWNTMYDVSPDGNRFVFVRQQP
jgi:Tol biopolymer transport system component